MNNQEKLSTLDTHDTGQRQKKEKHNTESFKDEQP